MAGVSRLTEAACLAIILSEAPFVRNALLETGYGI